MRTLHDRLIAAGLAGFRATGLHRMLAPLTRGQGAILAFHHVRPSETQAFAPNRGLEITPEHLDAVLGYLRRENYRIVPLDAVLAELAADKPARFVALTFDDGYRDTLVHALPVLEHHAAPFTVFVTTGFAERNARLWWLDLEDAIARRESVRLALPSGELAFATRGPHEKHRAFAALARRLRQAPPILVAAALDQLGCPIAEGTARVAALCLDWDGIARLAAHPLATIGCHTLTHPCLAALDVDRMREELDVARSLITARVGQPVRHLAYPYGGPTAAGAREFGVAAESGFATAVTTRPGILRRAHAARPTALPRVSVNGLWPSLDVLDILLSGAPFRLRDLVAGAA